jgi:hypothetical protein
MELSAEYRNQPVTWLSIHAPNLTSFEELDRGIAECRKKYWGNREFPFTTTLDLPMVDRKFSGQTAELYGAVNMPTLIVIDQEGKVVGPVSENRLEETISRLLQK